MAPMTVEELFAYLAEHGFTSTSSKRVHHHRATGARVVVDTADPVDLRVHAYSGAWQARLTRAPVAVVAATVTAATTKRPRP